MRTIILTLVMTAITMISMAQFPQNESTKTDCYISSTLRAAIVDNHNSTVDVKLAKLPGEVIKIRVTENKKDGKLIYQDRIKSKEIVDLTYDIHNLPVGSYTFEIVQNKDVVFSKSISTGKDTDQLAKK